MIYDEKHLAPIRYTNAQAIDFLEKECRHHPTLWEEFGGRFDTGRFDAEFWETLSERLDCFRICEECGQPMIEGYVVDGRSTYCSDECLHRHISEEKFETLYDNGNGDTYWTTWYEESAGNRDSK